MQRTLLLLLISLNGFAFAQTQPPAPVERPDSGILPSVPQPAPPQAQRDANRQWQQLIRATHYTRPEIRIQAVGDPIHCDVDKVTPDEIFCTEHRANSGLAGWFIPREEYHVPRSDIRDVRTGGRGQATALGAAIGIGLGVGLGSINQDTRAEGGQVYVALLLGSLGALIGHAYTFAGHPIYRQP